MLWSVDVWAVGAAGWISITSLHYNFKLQITFAEKITLWISSLTCSATAALLQRNADLDLGNLLQSSQTTYKMKVTILTDG